MKHWEALGFVALGAVSAVAIIAVLTRHRLPGAIDRVVRSEVNAQFSSLLNTPAGPVIASSRDVLEPMIAGLASRTANRVVMEALPL